MEIQYMPLEKLVEYVRNPRKNDDVVDKMVACIKEFGFRIPIVAKSDGTVVDGHLRLKAARQLGLKEVPVVIADDLSDAQIKAFRLIANRSANWADWDDELLRLEFKDLDDIDFDLELTGFDLDEINFNIPSVLEHLEAGAFSEKFETERKSFAVTFIFPREKETEFLKKLKEVGKDIVTQEIMNFLGFK